MMICASILVKRESSSSSSKELERKHSLKKNKVQKEVLQNKSSPLKESWVDFYVLFFSLSCTPHHKGSTGNISQEWIAFSQHAMTETKPELASALTSFTTPSCDAFRCQKEHLPKKENIWKVRSFTFCISLNKKQPNKTLLKLKKNNHSKLSAVGWMYRLICVC